MLKQKTRTYVHRAGKEGKRFSQNNPGDNFSAVCIYASRGGSRNFSALIGKPYISTTTEHVKKKKRIHTLPPCIMYIFGDASSLSMQNNALSFATLAIWRLKKGRNYNMV